LARFRKTGVARLRWAAGVCLAVVLCLTVGREILAEVFTKRGNFYNLKGDYDRAIADYNEAIRSIRKMLTPSTTEASLTTTKAIMTAPSPTSTMAHWPRHELISSRQAN
jgi:hypothetical protein